VALHNEEIIARACVPPTRISDGFNAISWLKKFAKGLEGIVSAPKGKNPKEVVNMKPLKTSQSSDVESALEKCRAYASSHFNK